MGRPIARTLAAAGFDVTAFDVEPARLAGLDALGVRTAASAAALAAASDLLLTVLPGPPEIERAMAGTGGAAGSGGNGLLDHLRPGACWLDLSSSDPDLMARLSRDAADRGVLTVEAPLGGGVEAAEAAELSFFVSGEAAAIELALPVLAALSARAEPGAIRRLGEAPGAGNTAKLLANLLWFGQSIAVTEALLLGSRRGIDPRALQDALTGSAGGSAFIDRHLDRLLAGDDMATFGLDRVVEELDTLTRLAADAELPFALSNLVAGIHHRALQRFGAVDGELLAARLLEAEAGISLVDEAPADTHTAPPSPAR
ncbi:NAD(P)-binding domain-containing protein [Subtercola endophyticus]|nr:NAD(P)-binding domain-containing protein [Subtercola endophyticus]